MLNYKILEEKILESFDSHATPLELKTEAERSRPCQELPQLFDFEQFPN
jgi:hypothetical protein